MEKVIFKAIEYDADGGEVTRQKIITKKTKSVEHFIQTYVKDIGILLKCTKGQINLLICIIKNGFISFDTNELILNGQRRQALAECSNIKLNSIYSLIVGLKGKNVIVSSNKRDYMNPNLFFFGSDMAREKMFTLKIDYKIEE